MDPRDRLRPLPDGATCTACGAAVPMGRIWLDTLEDSGRRGSVVDR